MELHLADLHTGLQNNIDRGQYTYLASLDVSAAFDKVPRDLLLASLAKAGVGGHLLRYVSVWLKSRVSGFD